MKLHIFKALVGLLLVVAVVVGLLLVDSSRAPTLADSDDLAPAIAVRTELVSSSDGYIYSRELTGRVRAGRSSKLGFERAGKIARILVDEGESVAEGSLLAALDRDRLLAQRREQQASLKEAEANLALAKVTLTRLAHIVSKGAVSQQGLDEAKEAWRAANARLKRIGRQIEATEVDLDKSELRAPYAGVITSRNADEGRVLQPGAALFGLQEAGVPEIHVGLAGPLADRLQPGEIHHFTWSGERFEARLRTILPLRSAARTVAALFDPLAESVPLRPGDLVRLVVSDRIEAHGYWLPLTALVEGRRGLWGVYVTQPQPSPPKGVAATHRLVRRTVDLIHQEADRVFVAGTFAPGDRVVTEGLQRLVPGQWVRQWQQADLAGDRISAKREN